MASNPGHPAGLTTPKGKQVFVKQDPTEGAPTLDEIMADDDNVQSADAQPTIAQQQPPKQQLINPKVFRDANIQDKLTKSEFPKQIIVRPTRDFRLDEEFHITQTLGAEFLQITGYCPSDSFWGNTAFKLMTIMREYNDDFRDRLETGLANIARCNNAIEKQQLTEKFILNLFSEMLNKNAAEFVKSKFIS